MSRIKHFPWIESLLIVALAVALIIKPQTRRVSAAPPAPSAMTPPQQPKPTALEKLTAAHEP